MTPKCVTMQIPVPRTGVEPARVIAACFNAPKFRGRTAIIELAQAGDMTALLALEADVKLRKVLALRGLLSDEVVHFLRLPAIATQKALRMERALRAKIKDRLALRQPGESRKRATLHALREALRRAQFRTAAHDHEAMFRYSESFCGAESSTGLLRPREVGLCNAYAQKGFRVTSSAHTFIVSPAIFAVPKSQRWDGKYLWLSPVCRVRQGRGTSLVCEQRVGRKWQRAPRIQLELFR